jgi:nitroreductase
VDLLEAFDAEGRAEVGEFAYQLQADQWPEPFRSRQQAFGAPVALIVTVSRGPLLSALVDAGLFVQPLMLAARGSGLHTCPQASLIDFHPVLRRHAAVPADQVIVYGIALGYADDSHRVSSLRSSREPITSFARFYDS